MTEFVGIILIEVFSLQKELRSFKCGFFFLQTVGVRVSIQKYTSITYNVNMYDKYINL